MTRSIELTRRSALAAGASIVFAGNTAFAAADGAMAKRKMVVIICRGGMDGLSVSPPIGDRAYAGLRGDIAIETDKALKLDGDFSLHPKLAAVHALALKGEARIAPAIASPDRARSHFEAQDVLESGGAVVYGTSSGWLNRALEALPAGRKASALSVGGQAPLILRGKVQAASWSPGMNTRGERLPMILADLYAHDALLSRALASGLETESMAQTATAGMTPAMARPGGGGGGGQGGAAAGKQLGTTVANFMTAPDGPQVIALSLDGFDTHANQGAADGQLATRLAYMDGVIDGLATGLGPEWKNTVVVAATEFGRTARINGTRGTDHGTASTALILGGGLKKGGIVGDWPTLQSGKLFEGRDTAPTLDLRGLFKGVLAEQFGLERRALDGPVFPDSAAVAPVMGLV
ncbi:DUF1501 domain-containing protein [soil metagenome]